MDRHFSLKKLVLYIKWPLLNLRFSLSEDLMIWFWWLACGSSTLYWSISRWTCVGPDTTASIRTPTTNQLGLVNDWRTIHTILEQRHPRQLTTTWGSSQLPEADHNCIELVSCKCQKSCVRRCKCKTDAFKRTALSLWRGLRMKIFHNIHLLLAALNWLTWHRLCSHIFSTDVYLASIIRPL